MNESNIIADASLSLLAPSEPDLPKRKRGFAAMTAEQVRELARRGGVAAHRIGTAHEFSSEEARIAGRKGGAATHSRAGRAFAE